MGTVAAVTTIVEVSAPVEWNFVQGNSGPRTIAHTICDAYCQERPAELVFWERDDLYFWLEVFDEIAEYEVGVMSAALDPRRVMENTCVMAVYISESVKALACVAYALHIWYEGQARIAKWEFND